MADRWIEIHDGTILNLNNIVKIFTLDDKWILFDTSGHCTDISESDRKRIIELLNQNSCLELLLTNQNKNPERENNDKDIPFLLANCVRLLVAGIQEGVLCPEESFNRKT